MKRQHEVEREVVGSLLGRHSHGGARSRVRSLGGPMLKRGREKKGGWGPDSAHIQVEEEGGGVRSGARARARPGGVQRRQGHGRGGWSEAGSGVARVGHAWRMWAI
jgi:hypothetical protein